MVGLFSLAMPILLLTSLGIVAGLLSGLLGIGGGLILVPLLIALGHSPLQAVSTSSAAIVLTAASGTFENWRQGRLTGRSVLGLALPSLVTVQAGVWVANYLPEKGLLLGFALFSLANVYLMGWSNQVRGGQTSIAPAGLSQPWVARCLTGGLSGILAGIFGIGGGVILVPFQILLLRESIKPAIQTSLAVILITSIAAALGHSLHGNVLWEVGFCLGLGGTIGVQVSTRLLPKLSDRWVNRLFRTLLIVLGLYTLWRVYHS